MSVKREIVDQPTRDDVHEQREPAQPGEAVVTVPDGAKPAAQPTHEPPDATPGRRKLPQGAGTPPMPPDGENRPD